LWAGWRTTRIRAILRVFPPLRTTKAARQGHTRECNFAIDIARNFSSGWANTRDCAGSDANEFSSFAPFVSEEAVALRNFIQNHHISMAVVVHSNAQDISNLWTGSIATSAVAQLAAFVWSLDTTQAAAPLAQNTRGGGLGQFAGWLSSSSDTAGEPDINTRRGIQTFLVELPPADYTDFWASPNGTGNRFHPSSDRVLGLIQQRFIPMAIFLTAASAIPGCLPQYGCPARDFGLVGGK
jgi:hypothetical protein